MKRLFFSFALLLFLFQAGCSHKNSQIYGQTNDPQTSDPSGRYSWPHEKSDLEPDPALKFGRFENGMRYAIMKNRKPEGRISIHLNVQAGSGYENQGEEGIAHFIEHMLFNGTKSYPPGELVKYFQSIGMSYGSDLNARTGYDSAIYDIMLPSGDEKTLNKGLSVLAEFAEGALLLENEIEKERGVILSEKRARNNAGYRTMVTAWKFLFDGLRLPERIPIGSEQVINTAGKRLMKDFYDSWYRPDRMMVVIVGDTDPVKAEELVRKNFAGIRTRAEKREEPKLGRVDHKGEKALYFYEKESGGATVSIDVVRNIPSAPDTVESEKTALKRMMAMGILQERLDSASRKTNAPFTKIASGTYTFLREIDHSTVHAGCEQKNWEKAVTDISREIETAIKFGFKKDEAERIKKRVLAGIDRDISTASTRDSKILADEIIDSMNDGTVFYSPEYQKKTFAPFIQSLACEDLSNSFREIWKDDHRLIMVTGNVEIQTNAEKPEEKILAAYRKGKELASAMPEPEKTVKFPYLKIPADPGKIIRKTRDKDLDITTLEFKNGIVFHYKKTAFKADEIIMNVSFGEGRFSEPDAKPGLSFLSEPVINDSGTGTITAEDLDKTLAGKNIHLSFQAGDDRFHYQCSSSKNDLKTLFELVYSKIQDPGFREEALERKKKQHEQDYAGLTKSAEGVMRLRSPYFLSGNNIKFMIPEPAAIKKYRIDDLEKWITPSITKDPMEISIAGDFDENEIINLASFYFASLADRKPFGKIPNSRISFPVGKKLELSVASQEKNASIHIVWPVPDVKGINDLKTIRRLNILAAVLENRLIKIVREKLGETYSPQAAFDLDMAYEGSAGIHAFINAGSEKTDGIVKTAMKISAEISGSEITDQEFEQAINPVLTGLKEKLQKNIYWVNGVMSGSIQQPEKLKWSKNAMQDHRSIKKAEVAALGRKYLDNKKAAVIIVKSISDKKNDIKEK